MNDTHHDVSSQVDLVELPLDLLDDHPKNPRILFREDVIDGIAACLNETYPKQHALHVRPKGERYEIIAGHHRKRAALKAELTTAWCWVETMSDEDAYMALATGNNQGELSPLELGFHALRCVDLETGGRGKRGGLSAYAAQIGKTVALISMYKKAAEVADYNKPFNQLKGLLDKTPHLYEISSLPRQCWFLCTKVITGKDLSVTETNELVKKTKQFLETFKAPLWLDYLDVHECASSVFDGRDGKVFFRLRDLAEQVLQMLQADERTRDLAQAWCQWLSDHKWEESWDIRKVQDERIRLEQLAWERTHEPEPEKPAVGLIVADPPWRYDFSETDSRQIENQYASSTVEHIIEHLRLPQIPPIADDCVLFLWATAPKLWEALAVMQGWGFSYKTHAIWDKQTIGMGYWWRGRHELLLVGTRGDAKPPAEGDRIDSIFSEARGEHSAKPSCVYEWIEKAFPHLEKFEMYARTARPGWASFGNEVTA